MKFKLLIFSGLMVLFFFGEIAISFSDKSNSNSLINDENLSFALDLENGDTHTLCMRPCDCPALFSSYPPREDLKQRYMRCLETK